jgi:hypothetical protein
MLLSPCINFHNTPLPQSTEHNSPYYNLALAERVIELSFGGATVKFGDLIAKGTKIVDDAPEASEALASL